MKHLSNFFLHKKIFSTVDLWTTFGLRVQILCAVENLSITLQFVLHICGSTFEDQTNAGLCSTVVYSIEKKSTYKWTHAVQTLFLQESTEYKNTAARFKSYKIFGKLLHIFYFITFICKMVNNSNHLSGLWWGFNKLIHAAKLENLLVHSKCYMCWLLLVRNKI